jgi:hypothetical protein
LFYDASDIPIFQPSTMSRAKRLRGGDGGGKIRIRQVRPSGVDFSKTDIGK